MKVKLLSTIHPRMTIINLSNRINTILFLFKQPQLNLNLTKVHNNRTNFKTSKLILVLLKTTNIIPKLTHSEKAPQSLEGQKVKLRTGNQKLINSLANSRFTQTSTPFHSLIISFLRLFPRTTQKKEDRTNYIQTLLTKNILILEHYSRKVEIPTPTTIIIRLNNTNQVLLYLEGVR